MARLINRAAFIAGGLLMTSRVFSLAIAGALLTAFTSIDHAEMAISVYSDFQTAPHSDIEVSDDADFRAGWEGKAFEMPPTTKRSRHRAGGISDSPTGSTF
jgi:hypothetical protein